MSTKMKVITMDGVPIQVEKKQIKTLRLTVHPPDGRVHISAPVFVTYDEITRFARSRMDWILAQREKYRNAQPPPELTDGDRAFLFGVSYPLRVEEVQGKPRAYLEQDKIVLALAPGTSREDRERLLNSLYREQLALKIPPLLAHWEPVMAVKAQSGWTLREMKTRWGSCNVVKKRVCLNLQLAKKHPDCLEYVMVHELAHLLEPSHNANFKAIMTRFLPDWKQRKALLNKAQPPQ